MDSRGTTQPKYQINGALQPTHAWTNFNYGDQYTINSWWEAYSDTSLVLVNSLDTFNTAPDIYQINNFISTNPSDTINLNVFYETNKLICFLCKTLLNFIFRDKGEKSQPKSKSSKPKPKKEKMPDIKGPVIRH